MRIALLTQYYPPETGAPQVRLAAVVRRLRARGHAVEVVTALPNHPTGRIFPEYRGRCYRREVVDGVVVHRWWVWAAIGGGWRRMINYASFAAVALFGLLRLRRRPQLLFVESPPLFVALPALWWARVQRVPATLNVADLWPDSIREMGFLSRGRLERLLLRLERWSYARSAAVTAVTEGIRETLIERKGVPPECVVFLPNGVDPERFAPQPPEPELLNELGITHRQLIVYAGTVGYAQGLDTALDALWDLRDRHPELALVLLGDGSDRARLQARCAERGQTNVIFLDPRPPEFVPRLLAHACAGLVSLKRLPLFEGARPSKLFPVMACARPVLYSGRGEGARLVAEAGAGLVAEAESVAELSAAIERLLADPAAAAAMGERGRRWVLAHLTWDRLVDDWLSALRPRLRTAR